jgi:CheY-like chemotaxis protein
VIDPADPALTVMFVERDTVAAEMYRLKLELDGYSVTVVGDGASALLRAVGEPPDLVFLGSALPPADGLSILKSLKHDRRTRHLPVVLLTRRPDPDWARRADRLGALVCPVEPRTRGLPADWWIRSA